MIIRKLALELSESDINNGLSAALEKMSQANPAQADMMKKVKNPHVELKDGKLIFKCKASMGILPVPVEAQIRLAPADSGAALTITLAKVSLAMMGGEAIASQLMGQLATAVAGRPGFSVSGNTLTITLPTLAELRGIRLEGTLNDIAIVNGTIAVDFS